MSTFPEFSTIRTLDSLNVAPPSDSSQSISTVFRQQTGVKRMTDYPKIYCWQAPVKNVHATNVNEHQTDNTLAWLMIFWIYRDIVIDEKPFGISILVCVMHTINNSFCVSPINWWAYSHATNELMRHDAHVKSLYWEHSLHLESISLSMNGQNTPNNHVFKMNGGVNVSISYNGWNIYRVIIYCNAPVTSYKIIVETIMAIISANADEVE